MKRRTAQLVGALVLAGLAGTAFAGDQGIGATANPVRLEEATMIVEVDSTVGDAGVQFFLDGEPWRSMTISAPNGRTLLNIDAEGRLKNWGLTELFSESNEPPFDEVPLEEFKQRFPEGRYTFVGETIEGDGVIGSARLSLTSRTDPADYLAGRRGNGGRAGVVARWSGPPSRPASTSSATA